MKVARFSVLRTGCTYSQESHQGHRAAEKTAWIKSRNDPIGNRNRDLPACSAEPQPTAPPLYQLCRRMCGAAGGGEWKEIPLLHTPSRNTTFNYWGSGQTLLASLAFVLCWWYVPVCSRVQKFPAWHTKTVPNGKCCEGYIVPSMVRLMYQLKSVLK